MDPATLQPDGAAVDMLKAIGKTLGVETRIANITFSGIFPALDTNKCDAIMSSTSKSPERLQKYSFVDYWAVGSGIVVKRSQTYQPKTFEELSGHSVSVLLGSRNQQRLVETNAALAKDGKPLIDIASFPAATIAFQELNLGRVDAMVNDTMVLAYFIKLSRDKFAMSGSPVQPTTFGMVIPKANADVAEAIQAAVNRLAKDGGLDAIASKWGVEGGLTICRTPAVCP